MKKKISFKLLIITTLFSLMMAGCVPMKLNITKDYSEPLEEYTLQGDGGDKVLLVSIKGFISDTEREEMMRKQPSFLKELVSQIKKAEFDPNIKAIVLKISSPGGTVTASDILYNELEKLKSKRGIPLVACMMDLATSGGYYVSLPADHILAHQTTITGSVGVVFIRPKISGLMDKIGIAVETSKSGKDKDMGSPFRSTTEEELKLFQAIIDEMADLFESKIRKHRKLNDEAVKEILTAKVYTAKRALELGMIDQIGYTDDAIDKAKELAGLDRNARVIMYRRTEFADDNIYNDITTNSFTGAPLLDLGPLKSLSNLDAGFYFAWPAAIE